jgi:hypothetical protein
MYTNLKKVIFLANRYNFIKKINFLFAMIKDLKNHFYNRKICLKRKENLYHFINDL